MSSPHSLLSRTSKEVLWTRRRNVLQATAAWLAAVATGAAWTQELSNIVSLQGDVLRNGDRLRPDQRIEVGDTLHTGPDASLVFVQGRAAIHLRANTRLVLQGGLSGTAIHGLRLLTGGMVAVLGKGLQREVHLPFLTAGIRGTGLYAEVFPQQANRSYLCNCYGLIEMQNGTDRVLSQADYHQAYWGEPQAVQGRHLTPAKAINHTDEEVEFLAEVLAEHRTNWQILGRKGNRDGKGYMDDTPGQMHPAEMIGK